MLVASACHDNAPELLAAGAPRPARSSAPTRCCSASRLDEHRERRVAELPGGVRKLLDIAMAMTGAPKLLLLDEPTSGVSADEKFPMMDIVMGALGQGERDMTVLFVEHDMDIVERYASRVVAFYSGRIIADDAPRRGAGGPTTCGATSPANCSRLGEGSAMLQVEGIHVAIQSVVGAARPFAGGRRRHAWSAWSGATAPARPR